MKKFFRGNNVNGIITAAPDGSEVFPFPRGRPNADMIEAECDECGNLCGNHRPILAATLRREEAERRKSAAILEAKANPASGKGAAVKRYYRKSDGSIVEFGPGPVSFEKWATQVMGPENPTLIRPDCTEDQFSVWKEQQGYKVRESGNGTANNVRLRDEVADLKAQLAAQAEASAKQTALLEQLLAQQTGSGKKNNGKTSAE